MAFLAVNMNKKNKVVFELVDLKYDWWKWSRQQFGIGIFIEGFVNALLFVLVIDIFMWLAMSTQLYNMSKILLLGSTVGSILIGVLGCIFKLVPSIEVKDGINWSYKLYSVSVWKVKLIGLIFGTLLLLVGSLLSNIILGLFFGLFFGLLSILFFGLVDHLKYNNIPIVQITHPYERFNASARVLHFSILQHKHLLYLLSKKGLLPYRLVAFLDAMVKQHILESDGATWRFRHGLLQKYFSEQGFE